MTDRRQLPRRTNGSAIASARIARGMTQAQLGAAIGVSGTQMSNWERGDRRPKLDALRRIADALSVPLDDLLN